MAVTLIWLWFAIAGLRTRPRKRLKQETEATHSVWVQRPFHPALLSSLYPGLGQFYNGTPWRGLLFLIFFTVSLRGTCRIMVHWYWQLAEVPAALMLLLASGLLSIWALAIMDAYMDGPPAKQAASQ